MGEGAKRSTGAAGTPAGVIGVGAEIMEMPSTTAPDRPTLPMLLSEAALDAGLATLGRSDPEGLAALMRIGGRPSLRNGRTGFEGLAATITAQQVSVASASAIWARLTAAVVPLQAETLKAAPDEVLRTVGLSSAKVRTLRAVAEAVREGRLPLDRLGAMPAARARRHLLDVKGIGPWTADVFLLFCLGEPDAFPSGDLALQEAYRLVFGGERRPTATELEAQAERWRPCRGVGAYLLWSCYRALRGVGVSPVPTTA